LLHYATGDFRCSPSTTQRGLPGQADVQAFFAAGFSERQILKVMLAMSVKSLSIYANHQFHTLLDNVLAGRAREVRPESSLLA
jgi:hypothetical protein